MEKGAEAAGERDKKFLDGIFSYHGYLADLISDMLILEVHTKLSQMDKGIRVGSWGQLQGDTFWDMMELIKLTS